MITSPPFWSLRDYHVPGQIGLEDTLEEYVSKIVAVFREARRVLRKDGTLWMEIGDCWAGSWGAMSHDLEGKASRMGTNKRPPASKVGWGGRPREDNPHKYIAGLKAKDECDVPHMVKMGMKADGWYARETIIWSKPNPRPESVRDRCTKAHSFVFMFAKSRFYYYDQAAIEEPQSDTERQRRLREHKQGLDRTYHLAEDDDGGVRTQSATSICRSTKKRQEAALKGTRVRRSIWTVPTNSDGAGHFAKFPKALVEPMVLAGSPPGSLVCDPFSGSGTVGAVCADLGRGYLGIELNPAYAAMRQEERSRVGMAI